MSSSDTKTMPAPDADKRFPRHATHDGIECFNCGVPMNAKPLDTEYPDGGGRYRQTCPECGYHTYYDLERGDD